jgi:hypothetical protein
MIFTLLTLLFFLAVAGGLAAAYMSGALNPLIEQLGMYFFKAKAKAEETKLEAQGLKEGQDFMASECDPKKTLKGRKDERG